MFRVIVLAITLFTSLSLSAVEVGESLVRIETTSQEPNYKTPWSSGEVTSSVGAGFIVSGERIMTNAHVVSNARFLTVSKERDPKPYTARVLHVAHDCDLALLSVDDAQFFKRTKPLGFGGIPEIESTVSVYGYPIGGNRLSVTRGIVSRIDFQTYSHSGIDSHLTIQIDAAINPGNSGGPVLQKGKVVGVAFQGYSGDVAQNVGYMIPTPVVRRFLKDVEDGKYDRYMDLGMTFHNLFNPAARRALEVPGDDKGVQVGSVYSGGTSENLLEPGDVLMRIDGLPISSDGTIPIEMEAVPLTEVVERKFKGDRVTFDILRNGKPMQVIVPLNESWQFTLQSNAYDEKPRFVVFAGLVFQPVDQNFMEAFEPENLRLNHLFHYFVEKGIYRERPELVVLSNILPDPVNAYANDFRFSILDEINGKKIQRISDVAEAFANPTDYYVLKMLGSGRPLVLERKDVEESRRRILKRYGVNSEKNLEK